MNKTLQTVIHIFLKTKSNMFLIDEKTRSVTMKPWNMYWERSNGTDVFVMYFEQIKINKFNLNLFPVQLSLLDLFPLDVRSCTWCPVDSLFWWGWGPEQNSCSDPAVYTPKVVASWARMINLRKSFKQYFITSTKASSYYIWESAVFWTLFSRSHSSQDWPALTRSWVVIGDPLHP